VSADSCDSPGFPLGTQPSIPFLQMPRPCTAQYKSNRAVVSRAFLRRSESIGIRTFCISNLSSNASPCCSCFSRQLAAVLKFTIGKRPMFISVDTTSRGRLFPTRFAPFALLLNLPQLSYCETSLYACIDPSRHARSVNLRYQFVRQAHALQDDWGARCRQISQCQPKLLLPPALESASFGPTAVGVQADAASAISVILELYHWYVFLCSPILSCGPGVKFQVVELSTSRVVAPSSYWSKCSISKV